MSARTKVPQPADKAVLDPFKRGGGQDRLFVWSQADSGNDGGRSAAFK